MRQDNVMVPLRRRDADPVLVTGGAGFIGSNLADSLLADGREVIVLDDLSRPGVTRNLDWLARRHGDRMRHVKANVADREAVEPLVREAGAIFHLAAQTAVTTSLDDPLADFAVNAFGTLTLLDAVRRGGRRTPVIFASTNKVYGSLEDLELVEQDGRYLPAETELRDNGIGEDRPLSFRTPYGCSKGVADQYVLDYAASFDIPTAVMRMSCIYGPRQFGTEDQGWLAHFLIRALAGEPVTIYGDGKQVRDVLHVSDAVAAYRAALDRIEEVAGSAFNLGGGPGNAVSVNEAMAEIGAITGGMPAPGGGDWRAGDQLYFVADTRRLTATVGWQPKVSWRDGLRDLADWLRAEYGAAARVTPAARVGA